MLTIITPLLFAALGWFFNRFRGGLKWSPGQAGSLRDRLWRIFHRADGSPRGRDAVNSVAFGLAAGLALGNVYAGILAAIGMQLGAGPGWGRYIGALGGWETKPLTEVGAIDWLIRPLAPKFRTDTSRYDPRWRLMLWGAAGLSLRGALWAAALCLPLLFMRLAYGYPLHGGWLLAFIFSAGVAMPFCYFIGRMTAVYLTRGTPTPNGEARGWEISENYYGAALWGLWCLWSLA